MLDINVHPSKKEVRFQRPNILKKIQSKCKNWKQFFIALSHLFSDCPATFTWLNNKCYKVMVSNSGLIRIVPHNNKPIRTYFYTMKILNVGLERSTLKM